MTAKSQPKVYKRPDIIIPVRATRQQRESWQKLAKLHDMELSPFIRALLIEAEEEEANLNTRIKP